VANGFDFDAAHVGSIPNVCARLDIYTHLLVAGYEAFASSSGDWLGRQRDCLKS